MVTKTNIVITGANGLVGLEVLQYFSQHCPEVGLTAFVRKDPVKKFTGVNYVKGDLTDKVPDNLFKEEDFVLIHLASLLKASDIEDYRKVNVEGTKALLETGGKRIRKIIYSSSMSAYGQGPFHGVTEEAKCDPETDLALTRFEAEETIRNFANINRLPAFLMRPRFLFGNRDKETLPALFKLYNKNILIGKGTQRFSFIGVTDYAKVIAHLALGNGFTGPEVINIAYRESISLLELYELFGDSRQKFRHVPASFIMALAKHLPFLKKLRIKLQLMGQDQILDVSKLYSICPFLNDVSEKDKIQDIVKNYMRLHEVK